MEDGRRVNYVVLCFVINCKNVESSRGVARTGFGRINCLGSRCSGGWLAYARESSIRGSIEVVIAVVPSVLQCSYVTPLNYCVGPVAVVNGAARNS